MVRLAEQKRPRLHVKKGDTVLVLSGKDRGKRGKVIRVVPDEQRVVVEGVNVVKKHVKPTRRMMQGGIVEQEAPIASAKVMVICPRCNEPTRLGRAELEDGRRVRVCKKCGEQVDR